LGVGYSQRRRDAGFCPASPRPLRGSAPEPRDSAQELRGSAQELRDSAQEPRDSAQELRGSAQELRDSAQELRGSAQELRDFAVFAVDLRPQDWRQGGRFLTALRHERREEVH
jgi:uncharacterized coiled-coil DUF342 family protein